MLYAVDDELANLLRRGPATLAVSSEDADFPAAGLVDRKPWEVFRADAAIDSDVDISKDLELLSNGGFETWADDLPVGWTGDDSLGNRWEEETSIKHSGAKSVALGGSGESSADAAAIYRDVDVRAGERLRLEIWMRLFAVNVDEEYGVVRVQNLRNGMYLTEAGAWQSVEAAVFSETALTGAMLQHEIVFQVQGIAESNGWARLPLRITLSGAGGVFDDISLRPAVNFAMVYGHNLGGVVPQLQSSDDGSTWTTRAVMTIARPGFYAYLADDYGYSEEEDAYHRYWRIFYEGTNHEAIYNGQAFIGYATTALRAQKWGDRELDRWPQLEHKDEIGPTWRYPVADAKVRGLSLEFTPVGDDLVVLEQLRKDLWERSRGGVDPVIIVPVEEHETVVYGLLQPTVSTEHEWETVQHLALDVEGYPPPVVGL